jgi:hypothetical protein
MQPIVRDAGEQFDRQTHAYAEYRVFSGLAAERVPLASAVVTLARSRGDAGASGAQCRIKVATVDGETFDAKADEGHPYAAIDRAMALVTAAIRAHRSRSPRAGIAAGTVSR